MELQRGISENLFNFGCAHVPRGQKATSLELLLSAQAGFLSFASLVCISPSDRKE
jgi:hypothetical protein